MATQSTRSFDINCERFMHQYYVDFLYKKLQEQGHLKSFFSVDSKDEQIQGVDTRIIGVEGKEYNVDEKTAFTWCNKKLKTFFMELGFINQAGEQQLGWFIDGKLETDTYAFAWLEFSDLNTAEVINNSRRYTIRNSSLMNGDTKLRIVYVENIENAVERELNLTFDDITKVQIVFCNKNELLSYCNDQGLSLDLMKAIGTRTNNDYSDKMKFGNISLRYVDSKKEKPVGLLIPKGELYRIGHQSYTIPLTSN